MCFERLCPKCGKNLTYKSEVNLRVATKLNSICMSCAKTGHNTSAETRLKMSISRTGARNGNFRRKFTTEHRRRLSEANKISGLLRYSNIEERIKTSRAVKAAMHRPEVRKRHLNGLCRTAWINSVKTDQGQLELLEKWNRLGFHFIPNYRVHNKHNLFFVDGYDKIKNVVFEYDSKYHMGSRQKQKDKVRQEKIISILDPKKFWRYNAVTKTFNNIIGD